jgi:hypothetical protein
MTQWWAYLHVKGTVLVKRFFDRDALDDARESRFAEKVVGPFNAQNQKEAQIKAKKLLAI